MYIFALLQPFAYWRRLTFATFLVIFPGKTNTNKFEKQTRAKMESTQAAVVSNFVERWVADLTCASQTDNVTDDCDPKCQ